MSSQKVVILFTKLSDYILHTFIHWVQTSNIELHVIRQKVDQEEAPFKFLEESVGLYLYNREDFTYSTLLQSIKRIDPKMMLCAGWSDKAYLKVVAKYSAEIPTVMSMDNQWHGTLKQKVATHISPLTLKKFFSHVWVPGEPQATYAKKLGFRNEQIYKGFYVANSSNFSIDLINPKHKFKKQFIYVGRYVEMKGLVDLWQAFVELQEEMPTEWELLCIGTGPLFKNRVQHPNIRHLGFVQPQELKKYMSEGGVFVLPSHFEPWGVVVHEFALAGFPMLVSDTVGAATQFVKEPENGYVFEHANVADLKRKMQKMISLRENEHLQMGQKSYELSKTINEERWVATANTLLATLEH